MSLKYMHIYYNGAICFGPTEPTSSNTLLKIRSTALWPCQEFFSREVVIINVFLFHPIFCAAAQLMIFKTGKQVLLGRIYARKES
jgi:hypothetical protein